MNPRAVKAKGRTAENAVVRWLQANGVPYAERRRLAGTKDEGDITGIPGLVIEVKNCRKIELSSFMRQLSDEMFNADADTGVAIIKKRGTTDVGEWYAAMPARIWLALAQDAGWIPKPKPTTEGTTDA